MEYVDTPYTNDTPIVSPENAFMTGALKTDNLEDLRRFERAFPLEPHVVMNKAKEMQKAYQERGSLPTDKEKMDLLFLDLTQKVFRKDQAEGWDANIHFKITGGGDYTITVSGGELKANVEGLQGEATSTVTATCDDWKKILRYEMLEDSGQLKTETLDSWQSEEALDADLSDEMLEQVAGGKGCGAEASAATACGADSCGAAAGGVGACGAAACGADAGLATACGAAACGAAVGAYGVCGADVCAAAAGVGTACGAAAGVGACAGDVCGAAVGAGVCAGNVCGVDVLGGADIGPCAVNVIPIVPGC